MLYKDIIFTSKKEIKRELSLVALNQHFEFRIRRSSKNKFQATFKDDNCSFRVHEQKMDEGEYWQIRKFDKEHSYTIKVSKVGFGNLILFQGRFWQSNSSVIGELVSLKLRLNGTTLKPKDIMMEIQLHYGIHIQYTKDWQAKDHAESIIFRPIVDSFQRISLYL
ncbi:hypothetical protein Ddye_016969 [Dipteronia dyeriana]|uniref:Transposase MuDR plant domain-containing protein n=1 Tax=Dipteronia dyeriana TaxID=168575 RepID=A0AAD9U8P5_9ROSI|nr:hypothetical protein Ddye_016969 [Dipteronia dyeriana]